MRAWMEFLARFWRTEKESPCPAGKYSYGLTDTYTSRLFGLAGFTWSLTLSLNHSRVLISNPREERDSAALLPERVRVLGGNTELRTEASAAIQRVGVTIIGGIMWGETKCQGPTRSLIVI